MRRAGSRRRRRGALLVAAGAMALVLAGAPVPALATEKFDGAPLRSESSEDWVRSELHEDRSPLFSREPFAKASRHREPAILAAFGEAEPHSGRFVLHAARGFDRKDDPRPPVLLVHGAVVDATRSFGKDAFKGRGGAGLAAHLASQGLRVFAITFAHPHGCNWLQSEQVANAIARVRVLTGAPQVDVIAHSKGGISVRLYASNLRKPGMTAYRGDIRRLLLVGVPNGGLDVAFAYPNLNYWIIHNGASAPLVWTEALCYGAWTDLRASSLYSPPEGGGCFPGQAQVLRRWDGIYGLFTGDPNQWDVETTYRGGRGRVSISLGIDRAIRDGGDLIAKLEKTGVDARVEVFLLAGTKPVVMGFVGERRGPSDGLVLVRSALSVEGIARAGAKVRRRDTLNLSHVELAYARPSLRWIKECLE